MEETGVPNAVVDTSQVFLAPAGTPQDIIDRLAKETRAILQKPDVREKMLKASFAVKYEGPDQLRAAPRARCRCGGSWSRRPASGRRTE